MNSLSIRTKFYHYQKKELSTKEALLFINFLNFHIMEYQQALKILSAKTHVEKNRLENYKISDGKILESHLADAIKKLESLTNRKLICDGKSPFMHLKKDISVSLIATYFSEPSESLMKIKKQIFSLHQSAAEKQEAFIIKMGYHLSQKMNITFSGEIFEKKVFDCNPQDMKDSWDLLILDLENYSRIWFYPLSWFKEDTTVIEFLEEYAKIAYRRNKL